MTLIPGTRLGPYHIVAHLGAGGMGEVYEARDTRLGRIVAIKILPSQATASDDLHRRFEQEARAIASLNHPHICVLFDIGRDGDVDFMVMERLEGQTLAERLKAGPLAVEESLRHATAIADALDQAHRRGIVHRDIKPANIMVTKSGVKLLDFGLAQLRSRAHAQDEAVTMAMTGVGVVMGTLQYMAPEQVEGRDADARSDIFALGTVLYEMLTGRKVFAGSSAAALAASILKDDPPPIPAHLPDGLTRTLKVCWAKDPDERWQSAGDLRRELEWMSSGGGRPSVAAASEPQGIRRREAIAWGAAAIFGATAGVSLFSRRSRTVEPIAKAVRFVVTPTAGVINPFEGPPAISPDGRTLAYTAVVDAVQTIWVRSLDSIVARQLPGTETAGTLFWSPDSRSIGFYSQPGVLKRIELAGGAPQTICEVKGRALGAAWSPAGIIVFHSLGVQGVSQVPAGGGAPRVVTTVAAGEQHLPSSFLPDGRRFVFSVVSQDPARMAVCVGSLDSSRIERVLPAASSAWYAPSGHLLFLRNRKLMAQRFDTNAVRVQGDTQLVSDRVWIAGDGFLADYSVSNTGVLAVTEEYVPPGQLTWLDRSGRRLGTAGSASPNIHIDLSLDDRRVLVERLNESGAGDLWVLDLTRGESLTRLTSGGWSYIGLWSPDGTRVVYARSDNDGKGDANYIQRWDGAGQRELLSRGGAPTDWSRDGRFIVQHLGLAGVSDGLDIVPVTGDRKPTRYLTSTPALISQGRWSPDGRWMAYSSTESTTPEVYVRPFPTPDRRFAVSTNGGTHPRWRADGKEIFYLAPDGNLMAAPVRLSPSFEAGAPVPLFALLPVGYAGRTDYAVAKDGQRFLVNRRTGPPISYSITVLTDWPQTLQG